MKKSNTYGFTLTEIMIVVGIIGLLTVIALPSFVRARQASQTNVCLNNLRQIEAAKDQWALDIGVAVGIPPMTALVGPFIKRTPTCPINGTYDIGALSTNPACLSAAADHPATL